MPSKVILTVLPFMSISVHVDRCMYVYAYFGLLRTYFNPRLAARAKMSLSRAKTYLRTEKCALTT